eukprot:g62121.t1
MMYTSATRDPSKAQPSLVGIRAFESDLRRRPARRPGPTGSSATAGTWRRELADLARASASSGAYTYAADCKLCKYPATATPSIVWRGGGRHVKLPANSGDDSLFWHGNGSGINRFWCCITGWCYVWRFSFQYFIWHLVFLDGFDF